MNLNEDDFKALKEWLAEKLSVEVKVNVDNSERDTEVEVTTRLFLGDKLISESSDYDR